MWKMAYYVTRKETMKELEDYQQRDLDHLRDLFTADDPRGLAQMIAEDADYYDETLETVEAWVVGQFEVEAS